MKRILTYAFLPFFIFGMTSCESFFDVKLEQNIPTEDAYNSVQDVQNGLIGTYYTLGSYRFYGKNVVALGDMGADLAVASGSTGHFYAINVYGFSDTNAELDEIWDYGYKLVDKAVRNIKGANEVLAQASALHLTEDDEKLLNSIISQSYGLRALATFTLTNIFGLPYQPGQTNSQLGVCLLDKEPLAPFVNIQRSTVEECYAQALSDLDKALEYYTGRFTSNSKQFYMNDAAIYALQARIHLYMGNYDAAISAANTAIQLRNSADVSDEMYISMWGSTAVTDEDIFTIVKAEDDNLSANALNTLYGSYKGTLSNVTTGMLAATDIRRGLLNYTAFKYRGLSTAQAVSNIPVLRKSEMYLIIAESEAKLASGTVRAAQEALAYTAKRNTAFIVNGEFDYSLLPQTKEGLLDFIADERVRELFQEGHRWFDARRNGIVISNSQAGYINFDVQKFVYPIPAAEINAGFCKQQNEGWYDYMP